MKGVVRLEENLKEIRFQAIFLAPGNLAHHSEYSGIWHKDMAVWGTVVCSDISLQPASEDQQFGVLEFLTQPACTKFHTSSSFDHF